MFVSDIDIHGSFYGIIIRSPIARGRLRAVGCPKLPSPYCIIRAEDIPGKNSLADMPVPVLAQDRVSYIGEPLAILAGPDPAKLEEYAGLCQPAIKEEDPVFRYEEKNNEGGPVILASRDITIGDPERVFGEAKTIIEGNYKTGAQEHAYGEPVGAAAIFSAGKEDGGGKSGQGAEMLIHTATQWPFHVRDSAAAVLKMPAASVKVEPSSIGVHLDGKLWYPSLAACHAALASFFTQKPVKLLLTREEDFCCSPKRAATEITIRSALGEKSQLLGTEIMVKADLGAAGVFAEETLDRVCLGALGFYKCGNIRVRGEAFSTNVPPAGPFAGFGLSQGFFAMERHASRIADTLKTDPAEWRKNNMSGRNKSLAIGVPIKDHVPLEELLDTAAAMSDYRRKWASYELLRRLRGDKNESLRGIGIAVAYQGSGFLYTGIDRNICTVELTLEKSGSLEIRTSMISAAPEYGDIWRNIAAEILSVDAAGVKIIPPDTASVPDSGPSCLSRNIAVIAGLVERAATAIRKQRFREALPITVRRSCRPAKEKNWEGKPFDQNAFSPLSWAAAVVETEVDARDYCPKVRGIWLGVDGGKILSEKGARRAITFSAVQALSWASRETVSYIDGRIPDSQIYSYDLMSPAEIPPVHIDFLWGDTALPKGIGELPFHCVPAAYAQALSQAMDYPFEEIPLGSGNLWEKRKAGRKEETP